MVVSNPINLFFNVALLFVTSGNVRFLKCLIHVSPLLLVLKKCDCLRSLWSWPHKININNSIILQGGAGGDDFDDEWSDEEEEEVIDFID